MPDLTVVAERSEREIKRQHASNALKWAARDLTANLFRNARGAGKPEQLLQNINAFATALNAYADVFGQTPSGDVLKEMLEYPSDPALDWDNELADELLAVQAICQAVLQCVASGLLDQRIHREKALNDLRSAISMFVGGQERRRRQRLAALMRIGR